jgi:hypothetical protein
MPQDPADKSRTSPLNGEAGQAGRGLTRPLIAVDPASRKAVTIELIAASAA